MLPVEVEERRKKDLDWMRTQGFVMSMGLLDDPNYVWCAACGSTMEGIHAYWCPNREKDDLGE